MSAINNDNPKMESEAVQLQVFLEEATQAALDVFLRLYFLNLQKSLPISQDILFIQSRLWNISKITLEALVDFEEKRARQA